MLVSNKPLIDALQESKGALGKPEQWFFSCTILSNMLSEQGQGQLSYLWKSIARQTELNLATYHILVGATYIQLEDWEQAIHHNKEAIAVDQGFALGYSNLAKLYEKLGQVEQSREYLYQFMSLRPEQSSAERCEELGTQLLEKGQPARAVDCYRWAIRNNPEQWTAYYRVAHILTCAKQPERAMRYYQLLLERDPSQIEAHQKLGKLLLSQQQYDEAVEHFQAAIVHKPDFNWGYFSLAQGFLALERWEDVIEACQKALQLDPEQTWPYQHMAKAWLAQDKRLEAKICWQNIAALQGWREWKERDYDFTYNSLTHRMKLWHEQLQAELDIDQRNTPLRVIQIGGAQGMWSCWMLDCVLTQAEDQLLCLAHPSSQKFQSNLSKTRSKCRVSFPKEEIANVLQTLNMEPQANYDLIYIQSLRGNAQLVYDSACLSWPLLRGGGMLVFQFYEKASLNRPNESSPTSTIDSFLGGIEGEFQILHQEKQLFVRKQECKNGV